MNTPVLAAAAPRAALLSLQRRFEKRLGAHRAHLGRASECMHALQASASGDARVAGLGALTQTMAAHARATAGRDQ